MSLDGRIGKEDHQIVFSNRLDNYRVNTLRGSVDAVMVGIDTVLKDNPPLTVSESGDENPTKIVVDKGGVISADAELLDPESEIIIATCTSTPEKRIEHLENLGENVEVLTVGKTDVNLEKLLWTLYERGIRKVLVEGGRGLSRRMLDEGLVSEVYLTIAPMLIGEGISFVQGELKAHVHLTLEGILQYGDMVVLHYLVKND